MNTFKHWIVVGGVVLWLLAGCATPPEPFHYQPDNELKPGPGIFTGKEGVYPIYGPPPAVKDETDPSVEEILGEPDDPAAQ